MTWIFWAPASVRMTSNSSFSSSAGAAAAPPPASGDGHGGSGGDAELLLERVEELLELDDGEVADGVEDLFLAESHDVVSF
jgi:hypothetical protein